MSAYSKEYAIGLESTTNNSTHNESSDEEDDSDKDSLEDSISEESESGYEEIGLEDISDIVGGRTEVLHGSSGNNSNENVPLDIPVQQFDSNVTNNELGADEISTNRQKTQKSKSRGSAEKKNAFSRQSEYLNEILKRNQLVVSQKKTELSQKNLLSLLSKKLDGKRDYSMRSGCFQTWINNEPSSSKTKKVRNKNMPVVSSVISTNNAIINPSEPIITRDNSTRTKDNTDSSKSKSIDETRAMLGNPNHDSAGTSKGSVSYKIEQLNKKDAQVRKENTASDVSVTSSANRSRRRNQRNVGRVSYTEFDTDSDSDDFDMVEYQSPNKTKVSDTQNWHRSPGRDAGDDLSNDVDSNLEDVKFKPFASNNGSGVYICQKCCLSFGNLYSLAKHMRTHNQAPSVENKVYIPSNSVKDVDSDDDECVEFGVEPDIEKCIEADKELNDLEQTPLKISGTDESFESPKVVVEMNSSTTVKSNLVPENISKEQHVTIDFEDESDQSSKSMVKTVYFCGICHSSFNCDTELAKHMSTHIDKHRYMCGLCLSGFVSPDLLMTHMAVHQRDNCTQKEEFRCSICKWIMASAEELVKHMSIHSIRKTDTQSSESDHSVQGIKKDDVTINLIDDSPNPVIELEDADLAGAIKRKQSEDTESSSTKWQKITDCEMIKTQPYDQFKIITSKSRSLVETVDADSSEDAIEEVIVIDDTEDDPENTKTPQINQINMSRLLKYKPKIPFQ